MSMRPKNCLSRRQVAQRMGCSIGSIQRLEAKKKLTPWKDPETKRVWFDAEQVVKVNEKWSPRRGTKAPTNNIADREYRGKKAAQCFPYFQGRVELYQIVIETETDPLLVRELFDQYCLGLEDGRAAQQRRREAEREERRDLAHHRRLERAEVRKFRIKEAEILSRAGLVHLPPNPPTKLEEAKKAPLASTIGRTKTPDEPGATLAG